MPLSYNVNRCNIICDQSTANAEMKAIMVTVTHDLVCIYHYYFNVYIDDKIKYQMILSALAIISGRINFIEVR